MNLNASSTARTTTTTTEDPAEDGDIDSAALEQLSDLVDQLLDEEEEDDAKKGFQVMLRLSPFPEYLVKGYDFKMLNK